MEYCKGTGMENCSISRTRVSTLVYVRSFCIALGLSLSSAALPADLIWTGDFETGDFSQYVNHLYGENEYSTRAIVSSPTRAGQYATELTVLGLERPSGRERAEIMTNMPNNRGVMKFQWDGPEYWVGFSMYFKEWDAAGWTFFQIHAPDGNYLTESCTMGGNAIGVYPGGASENNGVATDLNVRVIEEGGVGGSSAGSNTVQVHSAPLNLGVWHDYVMRFKLSNQGNGFFEVWKDGQKVYSKFNLTNVDYINGCGNEITDTSHHGVHIGTYGDAEPTFRQVYFDEVRIAEGTDGFDLVDPGSSGTGEPAASAPNPPSNLSTQ